MGAEYSITLYDLQSKITQSKNHAVREAVIHLVPSKSTHTINMNTQEVTAHYGVFGEVKTQTTVSSTVNDYLNIIGPAPGVTLYFNKSQADQIEALIPRNNNNNNSNSKEIPSPSNITLSPSNITLSPSNITLSPSYLLKHKFPSFNRSSPPHSPEHSNYKTNNHHDDQL